MSVHICHSWVLVIMVSVLYLVLPPIKRHSGTYSALIQILQESKYTLQREMGQLILI